MAIIVFDKLCELGQTRNIETLMLPVAGLYQGLTPCQGVIARAGGFYADPGLWALTVLPKNDDYLVCIQSVKL